MNVGVARSCGLQGPDDALLVYLREWTPTFRRQSQNMFLLLADRNAAIETPQSIRLTAS